ncbi:MAG TPA: ABC transporter ATP-binding protein [Armatimonadota bacterium]|nr:ABC transporter ATP-binding protein [Armatimonadota bacterium]
MKEPHGREVDNLVRLLHYVKPYWPFFAGATACGMVKFLIPVAIAWVVGRAIDVLRAFDRSQLPPHEAWGQLLHYAVLGTILILVSVLPTYLRSMVGARAVQQVIRDLRCDLYSHIQKLSHSFFNRHRSGSLTSRIIGDVESIQPFLNQGLIQGWMNVGVIVVVLYYFFSQNVMLGALSLLLIPFQVLIQRTIRWRVKANARDIRDQLAGLAGSTQEKLAASTIVKTFTREDDEVQRFSEDSNALIDLGIRNSNLNGISQAAVSGINALAPLIVVITGGWIGLFHPGTISIGQLVTFIMMQGNLYAPFERLNEMQLITANALGATDRIFEIFDTDPEIADVPQALKARRFSGDIQFDQVVFSYPDASNPILHGVSLAIPTHSTLALVGPSGGGKSTITHLLNRFYDPDAGRILIDGRDIRDYTIYSLRHQIGLVPQDPERCRLKNEWESFWMCE